MPKVFIEETTLTAIGDAIRGKTGKTDLIDPANMHNEIATIQTGGNEPTDEELTLTGDISNTWADGKQFDWIMERYGDRITTKDLTNTTKLFLNNQSFTEIPFDLNYDGKTNVNIDSMFQGTNMVTYPSINNIKVGSCIGLFSNTKITEIPEDYFDDFLSFAFRTNATTSQGCGSMFSGCTCLLKAPQKLFEKLNPLAGRQYSSNSLYSYLFYNCYVLSEAVDLPAFATNSSLSCPNSIMTSPFSGCYRLGRLTFKLQEDGSPYISYNGKSVIDLTSVGYALPSYATAILAESHIHGITEEFKVTDATSYQALKNNPKWWTGLLDYCRYNKTSALETIRTLPDVSTYGTNTIKFKGAAGALTDGGAINTMTEEEIAVATVKGWTVTLS